MTTIQGYKSPRFELALNLLNIGAICTSETAPEHPLLVERIYGRGQNQRIERVFKLNGTGRKRFLPFCFDSGALRPDMVTFAAQCMWTAASQKCMRCEAIGSASPASDPLARELARFLGVEPLYFRGTQGNRVCCIDRQRRLPKGVLLVDSIVHNDSYSMDYSADAVHDAGMNVVGGIALTGSKHGFTNLNYVVEPVELFNFFCRMDKITSPLNDRIQRYLRRLH